MNTLETVSPAQQLQWRTLLIFMVVVGYIATFATAADSLANFTGSQIAVGVLFGIAYLILGMFDNELLGRFPDNIRNIIYFVVQCSLVFGIGMLLGPGGNWLIGLPLAGIAVERLSPSWRWVVNVTVLLVIILPIGFYSTWGDALMNGGIITAAIFFVILFTQLRLNEQKARIEAEELSHQLEIANHRLTEYASQAEELAITQERNRLAREIHDNLGHYLTIVNVQIEVAKVTCESDPSQALEALNKAQELASKGLSSVRESVAALRVSPLENHSLKDAIIELVEESKASGITTDFKIIGKTKPVESKPALVLYRVVQEGLTNVRKYASASWVGVELDFSQVNVISLSLRDNGVGTTDTSGGFGLIGLRERVQMLGGEFKIMTQPNHGFQIKVTLPLAEKTVS